jgi:uncharacterized protein with FMN-binding domain
MKENVRGVVMNPVLKKVLKVLHVFFVASVLGGILAMTVLLVMKGTLKADENAFPVDLGIFQIFNWPVSVGFFCLIFSSFVFSFFSDWGFIRYWWIIVKWAVLLFLFAAAWFIMGPAVNGMVSLSDAGYHVSEAKAQYLGFVNTSLTWSFVFLGCLAIVMFLSVLKPWGPTNFKVNVNRAAVLWAVGVFAVFGAFFGVMGSVYTDKYRHMTIADTDMKKARDGVYLGQAEVAGYVYRTEVVVRGRRIVSVKSVNNRKSPYAWYAEGVFKKILKYQNANVDAVTGATTTSKALMKSVENALSSAAK